MCAVHEVRYRVGMQRQGKIAMVDEFQAYLLLVVTALFVFIVIRVVKDDWQQSRRWRNLNRLPNRRQSPQ